MYLITHRYIFLLASGWLGLRFLVLWPVRSYPAFVASVNQLGPLSFFSYALLVCLPVVGYISSFLYVWPRVVEAFDKTRVIVRTKAWEKWGASPLGWIQEVFAETYCCKC